MYIILIGWLYVTMMMAVVEATSDTGTVLGAVITFALYGLLPSSIMYYLMRTPARKREIKARMAAELSAHLATLPESPQPDAGRHPPGVAEAGSVPPVGKEP